MKFELKITNPKGSGTQATTAAAAVIGDVQNAGKYTKKSIVKEYFHRLCVINEIYLLQYISLYSFYI
jgi:hypothetical protein